VTKLKIALLVILVAVLVDFAVENHDSTQVIKFFTFTLGQVPTFLLAYAGLAVGLLVGWVGHMLRARKRRKQAAAQAQAQEQPAQQSQ
jgi:uncharacterized integral membrane protein